MMIDLLTLYMCVLTAIWATIVVSTRSRVCRAIGIFCLVLNILWLLVL